MFQRNLYAGIQKNAGPIWQCGLISVGMVNLTKPQVICTHESDLDGFVAGLLLKRLAEHLFGPRIPMQAYHAHNWRQRAMSEQSAWITDLGFDQRVDRQNWVIVDHHTTDVVPKKAVLVHDLNKSAGTLAYELCKANGIESPELDRLVHLNNVADLFLEDDPDFVLANDYASLVKIYQFWNLHELVEGKLESLLDHPLLEVMAVKRRIENPLGYAWSKGHITQITPTVGYVDTVVGNINSIVHQLLERNATPYSVLLTLYKKSPSTMIASFRSRNGEAIKIAERLQGGGHANACGATLPKSVQSVDDAINFLKQMLDPSTKVGGSFNSLESAFASLDLK